MSEAKMWFQAIILIILFYKQVLLFNFVYGTRRSSDV